ncbi:hypothetical protein D3C79_1049190 [compost metagenome]
MDGHNPARGLKGDPVVPVPLLLLDQHLLAVQVTEQTLGQLDPVVGQMVLLAKDSDL